VWRTRQLGHPTGLDLALARQQPTSEPDLGTSTATRPPNKLLGVQTARRKAYTSAVSGVPTAKFAAFAASPQMRVAPPHLVDANLLPVAGGVPIVTADGEVIGAIGVAGADDTTDDRMANQARGSVAKIVA
jgi:uncharacterized protein GlcG (DUF336 family)